MSAEVLLGGVALGGSDAYSWGLSAGVAPVERLWTVSATRAEAIQAGVPLTLEIQSSGHPRLVFREVYVLEVLPGPDPFRRVLRVADKRWTWSRKWVAAGFNVRRATGDKFLANSTDKIETAILQPDIRYAKWSLFPPENGETPWDAEGVLREVFRQLGEPVVNVDAKLPEVEVQDLELDDDGAAAVERALAYLPGADVFVDYDGSVVIFNTLDRRELEVLGRTSAAPHATYPAVAGMVDKRHLRPHRVRVLFTPEVEVRFDFTEGGTVTRDSNELRNVAPVPDVTLEVPGRELPVARGTFLPLDTLFSAWGAFGMKGVPLSTDALRRNALRHGFGALEHEYGNNPLAAFDVVNAARIRTAVEHWRKTYQVAEVFMQRLASIRAVRVAILNTETGLYAPAEAYCDFTRIPTHKGLARLGNANVNQGWTARGYAELLADAQVAPAVVSVIDGQAGVIRVEPQLDPFGLSQAMALGYATDGKLPSQLTGEANRTAVDLFAQWGMVELDASFQLAVVLTGVPASPNDLRKFHEEVIEASELGETGSGPEAVVRVFPGVVTARYAWSDDYGQEVLDALRGLGKLPEPGVACVNLDQVQEVARASALRLFELYRDRPEGANLVDADPELRPAGTVAAVEHTMAGGVTESLVTFGAVRRPLDVWQYLSASTRRALLRVLHRGGTST